MSRLRPRRSAHGSWVEPSGAAGVAALLAGRIPLESGERVVALLSGGNVGMDHIAEWLAG